MKPRTLLLISILALSSLLVSCGDTGCTPPQFDFETTAKAADGWIKACLNGQSNNARQYWTRAAPEISDRLCQVLTDAKARSGNVEIVSMDEPISFLCMKQLYVVLRRGDGKKGLLVFFVESSSPSAAVNKEVGSSVGLMGVLYGAACPILDMRQPEYADYFESCFWVP